MAFEVQRINQLLQEVKAVCTKVQRNPEDIKILAATKYADVEQINTVISAGLTIIGENRLQDAKRKFPLLLPVEKHFIGTLQLNKVKTVVRLFDWIESVDRVDLTEKVDRECEKLNKKMPVLVEVNVAMDAHKHGIALSETFDFIERIAKFWHIKIHGLMAIIPYFSDAEESRHYFRAMKTLYDFCRKRYKGFDTLSMGMSHDFKVAIEEGSTEIRIGSYLFKN